MKKRILALALAVFLLTALLCGCGSSSKSSDGGSYRNQATAMTAPMEALAEEAYYDGDYYWDEYEMPEPAPSEVASSPATPAKIIHTATLDMETLEFDEAVQAIASLTEECGGYYESSSINDRSSSRYANYTVRVPVAQYRTFLNRAGELCHVLSRQEYAEDVSESYYDTSGRLDTQRTKLARLQELLTQAEDMEDIITIEEAISETEESIDRLSGKLRHYDSLVDYATVTVYLQEVRVYEPEPALTFGSRFSEAFADGWQSFVEGMQDIAIWLAYSWLWLLFIAAIAVVIVLLVKRHRKKHPERREKKKAAVPSASLQYSRPRAEAPPEEETQEPKP